MYNPNDPYGHDGLYTVQRERDAQLKRQEAETEAAARRNLAWNLDFINDLKPKDSSSISIWPSLPSSQISWWRF